MAKVEPDMTLTKPRSMGYERNVTEVSSGKYARMQGIRIDLATGLYFGASEPRNHGVQGDTKSDRETEPLHSRRRREAASGSSV